MKKEIENKEQKIELKNELRLEEMNLVKGGGDFNLQNRFGLY